MLVTFFITVQVTTDGGVGEWESGRIEDYHPFTLSPLPHPRLPNFKFQFVNDYLLPTNFTCTPAKRLADSFSIIL